MAKKIDDFLTNEEGQGTDNPTITFEKPTGKPSLQVEEEEPKQKKFQYKRQPYTNVIPTMEGISLSKLLLPPITRRRLAIYQLLSADEKIDKRVIDGPNRKEPAPFEMSPLYSIDDPGEKDFTKRQKWMIYSNDAAMHDMINKNPTTEIDVSKNNRIQIPSFENGQLYIDAQKNYLKYCWLELHPQNQSNKYRNKSVASRFRRIDIEYKSPHVQLMERDLAIDAEKFIIGLDKEKLINLAASFGIPATTPIGDMRLDMRRRAAQNPKEILFTAPDNKMTAILNISNALNLGILEFDPNTQQYYLGDDKNPVHQVLMGATPLEDFAAFLIKPEGADVRNEIYSLISFWH
jgi:hypothetical protein